MSQAIFVISTGRCGTQWLAEVFRHAGNEDFVTHESFGSDYLSREMLGAKSPVNLDPEIGQPLIEYAGDIERILQARSFIECGYPLWSSLPYLIERFAGRVRVIHLVRHPVPTAWSWLTQRVYCAPLAPHLPERVLLSPFDEGIRYTSFRDRWHLMTPYEKALFYWAEVNALALRLEGESGVPWMRVQIEDLWRGEALPELLAFAGLRSDVEAIPPVDKFRYLANPCDPMLIERHSEVMELARTLGYDPVAFDQEQLRQRYEPQRRL